MLSSLHVNYNTHTKMDIKKKIYIFLLEYGPRGVTHRQILWSVSLFSSLEQFFQKKNSFFNRMLLISTKT